MTAARDWTPAEVAELHRAYDGEHTALVNGVVVALTDRPAFLALAARYERSHFTDQKAVSTGNAEQDAARARYPTMFPG